MNSLIPVTTNEQGSDVVDSRLIAEALEVEHDNFLETIATHKEVIESNFGLIPFETEKLSGRGRPKRFCQLTEDQALFITTLSRNTKKVVEFKAVLVKSFQAARQSKQSTALSQLDILAQSVQILQLQAKELAEVKARQDHQDEMIRQIDARTQTRPDYFTVAGYASLNGFSVGVKAASMVGQKATKLCEQRGILVETTPDPRWGKVNLYPSPVLKEVFSMPI